MNYTYCERLMWVAIAPAAFRYLARQELGWDISALKQLSKQIYRQMVSRTPDIGSMMENPLRVSVSYKGLGLSQQAIFVFRGRGPPKPKIRQWVLAGCACYRNPSLVFTFY